MNAPLIILGFATLLVVLIIQVQVGYQFIAIAIINVWKAEQDNLTKVNVHVQKGTSLVSNILFFGGLASIIAGVIL